MKKQNKCILLLNYDILFLIKYIYEYIYIFIYIKIYRKFKNLIMYYNSVLKNE